MSEVNGVDSALTMEPDGELTAVIDSDTAAAIKRLVNTPEVRVAQHRQLWTPDSQDPGCPAELDGERCLLVQHHDSDSNPTPHLFSLDELSAGAEIAGMALRGDITVDDIKAGLETLSGGVASAQDVENAARAEEGLPPLEAAGLLDGPFNPDAALKAIFDKSVEVDLLRSSWQRKAEDAKDAKKEYEIGSTSLLNLINTFKLRRQHALNPSQPFLKDVSQENAGAGLTGCRWEQDHPGQPCPVCTEARKQALQPAVDSEVHPEHEGHAAVAERARVQNVLEPLRLRLEGVHVFTTIAELQALSAEDLEALTSYANEPTPMPPHIIARCCLAEEPGTLVQVCQRCDRVLVELVGEATALPVGAFVGLQCGAAPKIVETPEPGEAEAPAKEQTRTIKARGSKKTAKKNPEAERAQQAEAGRKAAAKKTPKR